MQGINRPQGNSLPDASKLTTILCPLNLKSVGLYLQRDIIFSFNVGGEVQDIGKVTLENQISPICDIT